MNYVVTRHSGALAWIQQHLLEPFVHLEHLDDLNSIEPSDTVIGTLPVAKAAEVCRRGARYLNLDLALPASLRGQELTATQLTELGAELVEYYIYQPITDAEVLKLASEREAFE